MAGLHPSTERELFTERLAALLATVNQELLEHDLGNDPFEVRQRAMLIDVHGFGRMSPPGVPPIREIAPFVTRLLNISSRASLSRARELLDELDAAWVLRDQLITKRAQELVAAKKAAQQAEAEVDEESGGPVLQDSAGRRLEDEEAGTDG